MDYISYFRHEMKLRDTFLYNVDIFGKRGKNWRTDIKNRGGVIIMEE